MDRAKGDPGGGRKQRIAGDPARREADDVRGVIPLHDLEVRGFGIFRQSSGRRIGADSAGVARIFGSAAMLVFFFIVLRFYNRLGGDTAYRPPD